MKARIQYMDGHYSMHRATPDAGGPMVDISDEEWLAYQSYVAEIRHWNERIGQLESSEDYQRQRRQEWESFYARTGYKADGEKAP